MDFVGALLYPAAWALFWLSPPPLLRRAWRMAWQRLPVHRMARMIGALGPRLDPATIRTYIEHGAATDPYIAAVTSSGMHLHSAADLLPEIAVPVLIVVGGRDPFSPPSLGREMAARVPHAILREAPLGTHGTLLEYPELVNGWCLDFLEDVMPPRGGGGSPSRPARTTAARSASPRRRR